MSERPRDGKGRFVKKEKKGCSNSGLLWGAILALGLLCIAGLCLGYISGYATGYHDGLSDNQPVIRAQGFVEGMTIADNQNELKNNWVQSDLFFYLFQNKQNPSLYAIVDKDWKITKTWESPALRKCWY